MRDSVTRTRACAHSLALGFLIPQQPWAAVLAQPSSQVAAVQPWVAAAQQPWAAVQEQPWAAVAQQPWAAAVQEPWQQAQQERRLQRAPRTIPRSVPQASAAAVQQPWAAAAANRNVWIHVNNALVSTHAYEEVHVLNTLRHTVHARTMEAQTWKRHACEMNDVRHCLCHQCTSARANSFALGFLIPQQPWVAAAQQPWARAAAAAVPPWVAAAQQPWARAAEVAQQPWVAVAQQLWARAAEVAQQPWVCLLYTSPSPRDLSTSRMPSSA